MANGIKGAAAGRQRLRLPLRATDAKTIRYGLGAVKGVGEPAVQAILAARQAGGPFKDLFDFCCRVDKRIANRRVIEALVRAGAFDTIAPASRPGAIRCSPPSAWPWRPPTRSPPTRCRAASSTSPAKHRRADGRLRRRRALGERDKPRKLTIGFFLSGHPFNAFKPDEVRRFVRRQLASSSRAGSSSPWLAW